ncbi:MAG: family 78 glycoside hydrolase catalytic domain [Cyclobacteriaceae bacterium]|nr:family 78 glycoside hydrolase catalytic domain [Cyclobacteriaceae bacterium]
MRNLLLTLSLLCASLAGNTQVQIKNPLTENQKNPLGIDVAPRFSWQLQSANRNIVQAAYEIRVSDAAINLPKATVWASGKINSDQSQFVGYAGPALVSGKKYFWQVRAWDNTGKVSAWSEPAFWQMGLLQPSDWKASWVKATEEDTVNRPSPYFRKSVTITKKIVSATAYITALGLYEAYINGKRIGDAYLTPGWTTYSKRLQYQVYDVTNHFTTGTNALAAVLGSGWYRGFIGFSGQKNFYGKDLALLAQIEIEYADGTRETIGTDATWKTAFGSIVSSEIYHGETIDARNEKTGWNTGAYNDASWKPVTIKTDGLPPLVATYNEPIRKKETFKPIQYITTPKGERVLDFGQNLVGWVQVKVSGKAGDRITLYHAEVLDKDGNFYTENLRPAQQKNEYILKGSGEEFFEPHFTFQGFRYLRIDFTGEIKPENFTAVALYSDMPRTGNFTSSHPLINQLQHNIQWGQRGNFLDVPTDCPQRDERLGWTGDAQAFSRTATFNFDVHNFFSKWLKDLEAEQENGNVPFVIPDVIRSFGPMRAGGSAGWADAATIIPWNMYLAYGDTRILQDQYNSMKAWVGYMERNSTNYLWNKGFHFGDWLFYRPFDDNDGRSAVTDKYLIAQCFFAHSTELVIKTAKVLGRQEDVTRYAALLQQVKDAFMKEYVTANGRLVSSTQTAYVLALNFDMLPENLRAQAAEKLVENVKSYGNHLTTGFLGTPYLCHVLSRFGYDEVAYSLLLQETYPSWLYPVKMGATTIWERWDGIKPDGTFQTPGMNSFNHYAYGAIGDWMYRVVTGIDTEENTPGYKRIVIKPHLDNRLTQAASEYNTGYGLVKSAWKTTDTALTLEVEIPANTQATVYIPASNRTAVTESGKPLASVKDISIKSEEGGYVKVTVGSGKYLFSAKK